MTENAAPTPQEPLWQRIRARLKAAAEIYEGIFFVPYRSQMYRAHRDANDAFLLMGFSDLLGAPNPVTFYALELYPDLIEEFHQWHMRMGMPQAPEGGFRCC